MKLSILAIFLFLTLSWAQESLQTSNGKIRRVVRRRGRQRANRQLFGNRVVVAPNFAPSAPAPAPFQLVELSPSNINFGEYAPNQIVQVRQPIPLAASPFVPAPAPAFPAPVAAPAPIVRNPAPVVAPAPVAAPVAAPIAAPVAAPIPVVRNTSPALTKPIGITRSVYNAPGMNVNSLNSWDYAFEAENGIKQAAVGEMKVVGEDEVVVMRGSYEYIGADGLTYIVNWEADENGFRADAPHLPQPVAIPFPEVAEAVEAQLRFAEAQRALEPAAY